MFSCKCCEISKSTFSYRTPPVAASVSSILLTFKLGRIRIKKSLKIFKIKCRTPEWKFKYQLERLPFCHINNKVCGFIFLPKERVMSICPFIQIKLSSTLSKFYIAVMYADITMKELKPFMHNVVK